MEFLLSSRSRVVAQLNRETERQFGVEDFSFSAPIQVDDAGGVSVTITPNNDTINQGQPIVLDYTRRVINDKAKLLDASESIVAEFVHSLAVAARVEFEPGCWRVSQEGGIHWLYIDDYAVQARIALEYVSDESL